MNISVCIPAVICLSLAAAHGAFAAGPDDKIQSHGREPADSLLLDHCLDAVVAGPQTVNQGLGLRVARQRNRQIGVSREPRLGPRRDGQTANQSERRADFGEIGVDLTQRRFERCHANRALRSMARPGQSPDSEPGRSKSHC